MKLLALTKDVYSGLHRARVHFLVVTGVCP